MRRAVRMCVWPRGVRLCVYTRQGACAGHTHTHTHTETSSAITESRRALRVLTQRCEARSVVLTSRVCGLGEHLGLHLRSEGVTRKVTRGDENAEERDLE